MTHFEGTSTHIIVFISEGRYRRLYSDTHPNYKPQANCMQTTFIEVPPNRKMKVGFNVQSVSSPQLKYTTCAPIFTKLTTDQQTLVILSVTKLVQIGEKHRQSKFFTPLDEVRFRVKLFLFRN